MFRNEIHAWYGLIININVKGTTLSALSQVMYSVYVHKVTFLAYVPGNGIVKSLPPARVHTIRGKVALQVWVPALLQTLCFCDTSQGRGSTA